ncbi:LacI family DNA-binding transcriptional regulator [Devosia sp.]|uniref:LacI family DNA-binding transcriptional regulator n=1 Tax=Devosia sp. TaxID=1871048 RepID=UPI00345C1B00
MFDRGVSVFLCSTEDNPIPTQRYMDAVIDKRVDGIIAAGKRTDRQVPAELSSLGVPVVYTIVQPEPNSVCFTVDDEGGGRMATELLIAKGRRRIAHVTGPANFRVVHERALGYKSALASAGLVEPEIGTIMDDWAERAGRDAVRLHFDGVVAPPDGFVCGNDQIARGVVDALALRGVRVPEDVSVIGYDNWHYYAEEASPPLTTVDMNLEQLGRLAGETLLQMIDGHVVEPGTRRLPCHVVERGSA